MSDDPQASGGVRYLTPVRPLHISGESHGTQGPNRLANGQVPTITYRFPVGYLVIGAMSLGLGLAIGVRFDNPGIMLTGLTVFLVAIVVTILKAKPDDVSGVGESQ